MKVATMALGAWIFGIPGALAGYIAGSILPASRVFQLLRNKPGVSPSLKRDVMKFALANWILGLLGSLVFGRTRWSSSSITRAWQRSASSRRR